MTRPVERAKRSPDDVEAGVAALVLRARDPRAPVHDRHAAFSALVSRFEDMAFVTALRACRDPEAARDACQEAFLTAWRALPTLREPAAFGAWLGRLVRTACARARRRRSAIAEIAGLPDADQVSAEAEEASQIVSRRETEALVRGAVLALPAPQREAIVRFYFLGEPLAGIARALGIAIGTAGKRVYEARLSLRRSLPRSVTEPLVHRPASPSFVHDVERGMLDEYVGEYRFEREPDRTVTIRRERQLLVGYGGGQRHALAGRRRDRLRAVAFDGEARFGRDRAGRVSHFVYYEFGRRMGVARRTGDPPTRARRS